MKRILFMAVLFASLPAFAQKLPAAETMAATSWVPRPMVFTGPSLLGNGYQTVAIASGGGLLLNSRPVEGEFQAYYMGASKTNDGTLNNRKGRDRHLQGRIFYRYKKGLYFGGGAQWSELSTTNYTKQAWRPTFGLGGDHFAEDWSCRWQVLYITTGTDRSNGVQGPEIEFWLPSPISRSHFFYRQTLGVYEFHTTVTDPTDLVLSAQQRADRHSSAYLQFTVGWKF